VGEVNVTKTEPEPSDEQGTGAPQDPPWMKAFGELRDLREETRRIQAIIDEEFGQIDEEDWR
jgi:hypothetical protein